MKNGIRPKVEAALSATSERLSPGSGAQTVRHAKNDLSLIGATQEDLDGRYANEEVKIAVPVIFEAKHPEGNPVVIKKKHEGLIIAFSDSFIYIRGMGFGARDIKALTVNEVSVEPVATELDGVQTPGLRITGPGGKTFALAIAVSKTAMDAAQQAAVRDELYAALAQ